ncbi:MAG: 23S rRNA (pseudouridine(1915)-N(3))-methyltransferase RlmH [Clostridia bacterium]|nr:23S rRNA (pseudouridine(1915)-N(3))-methyltransferase RlmH [Clostridia bacterium]
MNITIICVGKIKEKYLSDGVKEYIKRLNKYCTVSVIETKEEKAPENLSDADMEKVKKTEGETILKHIKDSMYVIVLEIEGKPLSSEQLAEKISNLGIQGKSNVTFVIGGSLGLWDNILKRADFKLSFSPMTFPHQLIRLILVEQIYRSFRIIKNEPYHK